MKSNFLSFSSENVIIDDYIKTDRLELINNGLCPFDKKQSLDDSEYFVLTSRYKNVGGDISMLGQVTTESIVEHCYIRISEKTYHRQFRNLKIIKGLYKYLAFGIPAIWFVLFLIYLSLTYFDKTKNIITKFENQYEILIQNSAGISFFFCIIGYYVFGNVLLDQVKIASKKVVQKNKIYNKIGYWVEDYEDILLLKNPHLTVRGLKIIEP